MKKINLSKRKQIILILICIFVMMLLLNILTPLLADDFSYSFNTDGEKLSSFLDVLDYQVTHYFQWGGRTVAHTIAQVFLLFPKIFFSIMNTFVYVLLVYLIYLHSKGFNKEEKLAILILIHFGLWFLLPVFGQTCFWLIGSCNYLWTTTLILLFLWIIRNSSQKESILKTIAMFLFGIIVGWTNENTAFGLIIITIGTLMISKKENKKTKILKHQLSGLIGSIIGFIILIIAPGNFVRSNVLKDETFIIVKLIKRVIDATLGMLNYTLPLIIVITILFAIYIYNRKKINSSVYVYLLGGFLTIYAMVLSPTFPERAWFGVIVFFLIACLDLIYNLQSIYKPYKVTLITAVIIISFLYLPEYITTGKEILELNRVWSFRIEYIEKEKAKGNTDIEIGSYSSQNKHNPVYGLSDISTNKEDWPNTDIAKYFQIKSIKSNGL